MLAVPVVRAFLPPPAFCCPLPQSPGASVAVRPAFPRLGRGSPAPDSVPSALVSGFGLYLFLLVVQETPAKS